MANKLTVISILCFSLLFSSVSWGFGEGLNRHCVYGNDKWHQKEEYGQYFCTVESTLQRDDRAVLLYEWHVYGLTVTAYRFDYQSYFNTRDKDEISHLTQQIGSDSRSQIERFFTEMGAAELVKQFALLDQQRFVPVKAYDAQLPYRYSAIKERDYTMQTEAFKGLTVRLLHERSTDGANATLFGSYSVRLKSAYGEPTTGKEYRFISLVSR